MQIAICPIAICLKIRILLTSDQNSAPRGYPPPEQNSAPRLLDRSRILTTLQSALKNGAE